MDAPQSVEAQTLEDSEKLYHRQVSKLQMENRTMYEKKMAEFQAWGQSQWEAGYTQESIDAAIALALGNYHSYLRTFRDQMIKTFDMDRRERDLAIRVWSYNSRPAEHILPFPSPHGTD